MSDSSLPPTQQTVLNQFDRVAANYRTSAVHARGADLTRLAAAAAALQPQHVLDLGCGAGHAAVAVAPFAGRVSAVDLSPAMLRQTADLALERGLHNLSLHQSDVTALPFAAAAFDVVISRYSAHHWPDLAAACRELARVMTRDGTALIVDVITHDAARHDTFLQTLEYLRDPSHVRDYHPREWAQALEAAGLQMKVLERRPLPLNFHDWTTRMQTPAATVAVLRTLLDSADDDLRDVFAIDDRQFCIPIALFAITRAG